MSAAQERIFQLIADLLRVFFILLVVRSLMLIGNVSIVFIPVIDDVLFMLWREVGNLANGFAGASFLPRF